MSTRVEPPPYGARSGFVPRTIHDFGDGGSFPEIHVAQFPLGLGKPKNKKSNALAVHLDQDGKVKYDALVRQGHDKEHADLNQFLSKSFSELFIMKYSRTNLSQGKKYFW